MLALSESMPPGNEYSIPTILYFGEFLPVIIGILLWVFCPRLIFGEQKQEALSSESAVSIGAFLIGLYLVGNNAPEFISEFAQYQKLSSIGDIGQQMASSVLTPLKISAGKVIVGILFIVLSLKIGRIYNAVRRFGV